MRIRDFKIRHTSFSVTLLVTSHLLYSVDKIFTNTLMPVQLDQTAVPQKPSSKAGITASCHKWLGSFLGQEFSLQDRQKSLPQITEAL